MSANCSVCGEAVRGFSSGDEPVLCAGCACPFCEQMATACVPLEQEIAQLHEQLAEACGVARDLLEKMLYWAGEAGEDSLAIAARWQRCCPWLFEVERRARMTLPEAGS